MKGKYLILSMGINMVLLTFSACSKTDGKSRVFKKVAKEHSKVHFVNKIVENDSLNYFTYPYIYLGGGVSAGDINNDGLIDLYFTANMGGNKLYLNKGNLQFQDITVPAKVEGDNRWYTGSTMVDINNDGFLDIYCSVAGKFDPKQNQLFINNGDNTFVERAVGFGLAEDGNSIQSTFFDYDRDGDLDVYVANYPSTAFNAPTSYYAYKMRVPSDVETDKLFRNNGDDTFTDVTDEAGLRSFGLTLSATVGDLNHDGWPDLYVSNDFSSPDFLYQNNGDGTFDNIIREATRHTSHFGMGVDIADINNDGLLDILQVDMDAADNRRSKSNMASMNPLLFWSNVRAGFHYQYMHNTLQLNNGVSDGMPNFSNISRMAGVSSTDWSWGPIIADFDNDGFKDVFIANGTRREINNKDYVKKLDNKINNKDSLLTWNLRFPSEKIDNFIFKNQGDLTFEKMNGIWGADFKGFSNGSVYVDLDNDGDLELVTNNIDDPASIFENLSSTKNNSVTLKFRGYPKNGFGLGVKANIFVNGKRQFEELTLTRGFQSSTAPQMHFGIGQHNSIDSLQVLWPNGTIQTVFDIGVNSENVVVYNAVPPKKVANEGPKEPSLFASAKDTNLLKLHRHVENRFDDFEKEILLPHQTSMLGPYVGSGDFNGDGLDDFIIGASAGRPTVIYFQGKDSSFGPSDQLALENDKGFEDGGIHVFDAEGDGDLDIYIASGGNEFDPNSEQLQDRLYKNTGNGRFVRDEAALPVMLTSNSRVRSHDFDNDGDLDLFVAGRLVPGNYPSPTNSYILENISTDKKIGFLDVTTKKAPILQNLGMVTDARWVDLDKDGSTDLVLTGEWMPIKVLRNRDGHFENVTEQLGLSDTVGWWFSLETGDFDNDGDQDIIAGNLGLNYKYQAKNGETFDIHFYDFDSNNTNDIVLSYINDGEKFPVRGRECSSQQMPGIKYKFKDYESFANATLKDIYTEEYLDKSLHYQVKSFASAYFENIDGTFKRRDLPNEAQLSSINKMVVDDMDGDGNLDALVVGNLYASEVETPRNDGGIGLFLKGDGHGNFEPIRSLESGFFAPGDVKDMVLMNIGGKPYYVLAKNSDYIQFIEVL